MKLSNSFSNLYLIEDGTIGILGGWGMGAPALSIKMEDLIALGVKKFIAVGIAGTLMDKHQIGEFIVASKALAEDGVAHLYLKNRNFAKADQNLKGAQAISFFVISDSLSQENWIPHIKEPKVRNNLHKLSDWALEFCKEVAKSPSASS